MRGMWLAGGAALLGGGAYVGGAFDRGEYYDMAPQTAETRLAGLRFGEEIGPATDLVLRSRGPAMLRWDVMIDHERIADVRAHLEHEDTGTRVRIDFAFAKGDALMGLEEDPFLNEVAEIAMEEKIDSALDRRAFNAAMVEARIGAAVAANPSGHRQHAADGSTERLRQNVGDGRAELPGDLSRQHRQRQHRQRHHRQALHRRQTAPPAQLQGNPCRRRLGEQLGRRAPPHSIPRAAQPQRLRAGRT